MNIERLKFRIIRLKGELNAHDEQVFTVFEQEVPAIEESLGRPLTYLEETVNLGRIEWELENQRKATDDELDAIFMYFEEFLQKLNIDPISGDVIQKNTLTNVS